MMDFEKKRIGWIRKERIRQQSVKGVILVNFGVFGCPEKWVQTEVFENTFYFLKDRLLQKKFSCFRVLILFLLFLKLYLVDVVRIRRC